MYIRKLADMRREERALLHERMAAVAKEGMEEGAWSGLDPYRAFTDLYKASTSDLSCAAALAVVLYCGLGIAVKITKLLRR